MTEKKETPQERYERKNCRRYVLKVVIPTEPDIYSRLENEPNVNGYIKSLIRADIQKEE